MLGLGQQECLEIACVTTTTFPEQVNRQLRSYAGKCQNTGNQWPLLVMMGILDQRKPTWRAGVCEVLGIPRLPAAAGLEQQRVLRQASDHARGLDIDVKAARAKRKAMDILVRRLAISGDYKRSGATSLEGHATASRFLLVTLAIAKAAEL